MVAYGIVAKQTHELDATTITTTSTQFVCALIHAMQEIGETKKTSAWMQCIAFALTLQVRFIWCNAFVIACPEECKTQGIFSMEQIIAAVAYCVCLYKRSNFHTACRKKRMHKKEENYWRPYTKSEHQYVLNTSKDHTLCTQICIHKHTRTHHKNRTFFVLRSENTHTWTLLTCVHENAMIHCDMSEWGSKATKATVSVSTHALHCQTIFSELCQS